MSRAQVFELNPMRVMLLLPLLTVSLFSQVLAQAATPNAAVASAAAAAQKIRPDNSYGAPTPPWQHGSQPGWYYGNKPPPGLPSFIDKVGSSAPFQPSTNLLGLLDPLRNP